MDNKLKLYGFNNPTSRSASIFTMYAIKTPGEQKDYIAYIDTSITPSGLQTS